MNLVPARRARAWRGLLVAVLALAASGCATLSPGQREHAAAIAVAARPATLDCDRADACAVPSPLHALATRAFAESMPGAPRHYVLLLDQGSILEEGTPEQLFTNPTHERSKSFLRSVLNR